MSEEEIRFRITAEDDTEEAIDSASGRLDALEEKTDRVSQQQQQTAGSAKNLAVGLAGVATSAWSLYQSYDNLQDAQVRVDRAMVSAKQAANTAEDAQRRYDAIIVKFGIDSPEAAAALDDLRIAQERAAVAAENAQMVQQNLSEAYTGFYISLLPASITMVSSLSSVMTNLGSVTKLTTGISTAAHAAWALMTGQMSLSAAATGVMTAAQTALNAVMAVNPIYLVVMALAALVAGLVWAYQNCEWFRDIVNDVGGRLYTFFEPAVRAVSGAVEYLGGVWGAVMEGMRWVWDHTIGPIIDALTGVWNTITGASAWSMGTPAPAANTPVQEVYGFASGYEGVISRPTLMMVGEAGPEYVSVIPAAAPYSSGRQVVVNSPLIVIQGSADEATAKKAAQMIMNDLRRY